MCKVRLIKLGSNVPNTCRFLRVSRQPVSSEFATEKHENSDSEEDEPEIADLDNDPRMVAYREAELVFQDFATRRFFLHSLHDGNSSETTLRVQANEAHISILEVCVDLIISLGWSNSSRGEKPNSLQRYALDFWTQHLERISVDSNNAVVLRVINILHHISVNVELFSRALQRHGPYVDIVLPQRRPDQVAWYDLYATWVDKASFLGPDVYSYDIQVWMKQPAESLLLLPLARGFSLAWVSETVSWGFTCGYLFTRRAIELVRMSSLGLGDHPINHVPSHRMSNLSIRDPTNSKKFRTTHVSSLVLCQNPSKSGPSCLLVATSTSMKLTILMILIPAMSWSN